VWLVLPARLPGAVETANSGEVADPPMEEILVSGEFPGPGLWKVSKQVEAGEHVLWIFGTLGDAEPATLRWKTHQVEAIVVESQEIIHDAQSNLSFDFGPFAALRHLPAAIRVRRNPQGATLEGVLPPDLFGRWRLLKAEYIGSDNGIEKWRPYFVAGHLRKQAERKLKPKYPGNRWAPIDRLVEQHGLRVTTPIHEVKIPDSLGRSMKSLQAMPLDDVECLDVTLKRVEFRGDDQFVNARAMAWARGDLPALRALPRMPEPDDLCLSALLDSRAVQDLHLKGTDDVTGRRNRAWLEAVDRALTANDSTLALLPIDELLKENGKLSMLKARGYGVQEPGN
jgi:hypothetical protein